MQFLAPLILAIAISFDGLGVGFTCGVRGLSIPWFSLVIISISSSLALLTSMFLGSIMADFFSAEISSWLGGSILILLGGYMVKESLKAKDSCREAEEYKMVGGYDNPDAYRVPQHKKGDMITPVAYRVPQHIKEKAMILVGLTGGIASGKSTVATMFRKLGWHLIDADGIAREVVKPGTLGLKLLCQQFDDKILAAGGELDRSALAKLIFADKTARARLNDLLHPLILDRIKEEIEKYRRETSSREEVMLDAPLLMETGLDAAMDYNVVVYLDEETQLQRLIQRDNLSTEAANQRIKSQMNLVDKLKRATFIINNKGSLEDTDLQVKKISNYILLTSQSREDS